MIYSFSLGWFVFAVAVGFTSPATAALIGFVAALGVYALVGEESE
jgi:hypothetical protein